jgi:hypothetical protein
MWLNSLLQNINEYTHSFQENTQNIDVERSISGHNYIIVIPFIWGSGTDSIYCDRSQSNDYLLDHSDGY